MQLSTQPKLNDINMPFESMIGFIIKWSIAAIPAGIILFLVGALLFLVFGGSLAALAQFLQ